MKKIGSECEFETVRDSILINMIVCNTNDNSFSECLLCESELTLPNTISAGHTRDSQTCPRNFQVKRDHWLHEILILSKSRGQNSAQAKDIIMEYKFCKNSHYYSKWHAYGKVCHNCNMKKHFKCCPRNRKTLHDIENTETESTFVDK